MADRTPLELRNLRFDLGGAVPRYWHGGRRSVTDFYNNLSVMFPLGERFFIASVHALRDAVADPALRERAREFCAQEGVHSREHARYNEMLASHGLPVAELEARVRRTFERTAGVTSARWKLATTCALEHFTAMLAQALLRDPRLLVGADPTMAALWRWHAAEELEHKSVAFDVYRAVGGTYAERCAAMALTTLLFWGRVLAHQARIMEVDGTRGSLAEWAALVRYLFVEPGGMLRLLRPYLAWYRPGFHPDQMDDAALLAAWRAEFASSDEYRRAA